MYLYPWAHSLVHAPTVGNTECGHSGLKCTLRRAPASQYIVAFLSYGGRTYSKELPNAWADYFADLATPTSHKAESAFYIYQSIMAQYCSMLRDSSGKSVTFTLEEVSEAVKSLKCNKAAGPDELDPEHLIYGGELLLEHLTLLFNAIMEAIYIPSSFLHGLVVPIPKGHNKDLSLPNNYRGITILSNLSKVLEKILLLKIHQQDSPPVLNPLQGGFREQVGCIHTAFILQEAIQSLREKGKKAYVTYLDVRKAFDTVWHQGLLVKLHQKGIQGPIWRIINKWYTSSTSSVIWDNQQSRPFPCHQGKGVFSPPSCIASLWTSCWTTWPSQALVYQLMMYTAALQCMLTT